MAMHILRMCVPEDNHPSDLTGDENNRVWLLRNVEKVPGPPVK